MSSTRHNRKDRTKWHRLLPFRPTVFRCLFILDMAGPCEAQCPIFHIADPFPVDREVDALPDDFSTYFSTRCRVGGALRRGKQGQQSPTATTTTTISTIPAHSMFIFIFDNDKMITDTTSPTIERPKQRKGNRGSKYKRDVRNNSIE